jgi:hypothetical protein
MTYIGREDRQERLEHIGEISRWEIALTALRNI